MISYNPKNWFPTIFQFHKADTFRKLLPLIIFVSVYSGAIAYLEISYFKLSENSHVKNIGMMHTLISFALSMLLVFRTNTAYDRWWEGRRLWGSLVNNSRSLAIKLSAILDPADSENRSFFRASIPAFADALKSHLKAESTRTALFQNIDFMIAHLIDHEKHIPNQVTSLIVNRVIALTRGGQIGNEQMLLLNNELLAFSDICGGCERIKNTPIPYSYSAFIKKFVFIYTMTLPFGFVFTLGYLVIPVVAFIFYVLASLELIAEEIEDPFGGDPNDVPTDRLSVTIRMNVEDLLLS